MTDSRLTNGVTMHAPSIRLTDGLIEGGTGGLSMARRKDVSQN